MSQKIYIGCKIIIAEPMTKNNFSFSKQEQPSIPIIIEDLDGYKVIYPDGYESWSPKEVFENAYREVIKGEVELFHKSKL